MRSMRDRLAALCLAVAACCSASAFAGLLPVIHRAAADPAAGTLTLDGDSFGSATGKAWLGKSPLAVQSWADKRIVAALPAGVGAGNHLVTVQTARLLPTAFVATIGGPAGAAPEHGRIVGQISTCGIKFQRGLVFIPGRSFTVNTTGSGDFAMDNVPPGTYDVVAEVTGYPPKSTPATVAAGGTADLGEVVVQMIDLHPVHCGACGNVCGATDFCVAGQCEAAEPQPCSFDSTCGPFRYCNTFARACHNVKPNGEFCSAHSECASGNCRSVCEP